MTAELKKTAKKYHLRQCDDNCEKICALCIHGSSLLGGSPAYCYKHGFRIDAYLVCDSYEKENK